MKQDIVLSILAAISGFWYLFLAWRALNLTRTLTQLRDISFTAADRSWPRVSVIVPACNEGDTIATASASLLAMDYPDLQLLLINDRSTDTTGNVIQRLAASDRRVTALDIRELPGGWLGKVHALQTGAEMADGEWVLFSDADVHFQKQSLRRAITYCHENQLDFLAVGPTLHGATLPLKIFIAQFLHLMGFGYSASRIRDPERLDVAGTGAFNLVRRPVLEGVGRFNDLKMEVLDDGGLGWIIKRAGGRVDLLGGVGEISVDWYPNLFAFVRGIEKNGFAFFQYSLPAVLIYAAGSWIIVLVTLVLPSFSELAIVSWICFVIYLLASAWSFKRTFGISPWMAFTLPVSFLLLPFIPLRAAILCLYRGGVHWRGTFYRLTELRKHQRVKVCDMIWKRK